MAKFVLCLGILAVFVQGALSKITNYTMDTHCGGTISTYYYEQVHLRLSDGDYRDHMRCLFNLHIMIGPDQRVGDQKTNSRIQTANTRTHDGIVVFVACIRRNSQLTTTNYRYLVHFETMDIEFENDCEFDFLTVHDGPSVASKSLTYDNRLCNYVAPRDYYTSSGNEMTFYFQSDASISGSGFLIVLTPFRTGTCWESRENMCDNGRCIDRSLSCVADNLCGAFSDCEGTTTTTMTTTTTPTTMTTTTAAPFYNYYTMDAHCGDTINTPTYKQVHLRLSDGDYRDNMICPLYLHTAIDFRYSVHFETMDIEYYYDCSYDFLTIHDGPSMASNSLTYDNRLCSMNTIRGDYTSSENDLTFYFESDADRSGSGFLIVLTPFRTGTCWESSEYTCDNGRCIDRSLSCVADNPCGDFSDCEGTTTTTAAPFYNHCDYYDCSMHSESVGIIITSVVGGVVFLAVVVVFIRLCRRRRTGLQRNQAMGVATIQLPYTNTAMYAQPPPYAQVTQFGSQSSLQPNYGQPPPYTPTGGSMASANGIPFPSTTGAAPLQFAPPTPANTASAPHGIPFASTTGAAPLQLAPPTPANTASAPPGIPFQSTIGGAPLQLASHTPANTASAPPQTGAEQSYGQPPPYTPTDGSMASANGIPFLSTTGAAPLQLAPPTPANTASAPPGIPFPSTTGATPLQLAPPTPVNTASAPPEISFPSTTGAAPLQLAQHTPANTASAPSQLPKA